MKIKILLCMCIFSLLGLSACSSNTKKNPVLPDNGPSMSEVFNQQIDEGGDSNKGSLNKARSEAQQNSIPNIDTDLMDGNTQFQGPKMLPNPSIAIYVYPHFDMDDQDFVPGHLAYTTLYEQAHFALPGEAGVSA